MVIIVLFWVGIHLIVKGGEKPGEMEASRFREFLYISSQIVVGRAWTAMILLHGNQNLHSRSWMR